MVDPNKAWSLFMVDPADFLLALGVVVVFAGGGFWLRGFILKERIVLSDNLKRARAEARELGRKLIEAENRNSMLQQMVVKRAPTDRILANVEATAAIIDEMRIITNSMGVALGPASGAPTPLLSPRDELAGRRISR